MLYDQIYVCQLCIGTDFDDKGSQEGYSLL